MPAATATLSDSAAGSERNRHPAPCRRGEHSSDARAFVAHHERDRRPPASAAGRTPSGVSVRRGHPDFRSALGDPGEQRVRVRRRPRAAGTPPPCCPRSTFGLVSSAVPLSAPPPRRRARARCGAACRRCRDPAPRPAPGRHFPARSQVGQRPDARLHHGTGRPAGARCRPARRARRATPGRSARPARRSASLSVFPRGVPSNADETAAPRSGIRAASASSTRRTPSATASPRRSRPRRRARSRMIVSSAPSLEVLTG